MLAVCALAAPAAAAGPTVILISWDGTRHDYPERAETPALDRLERTGARASRLVPVFPSNTFPGHVSLATGTHPDRHGIVGNVFLDRSRGLFRFSNDASWIEAEPLWVAAERQGVPTAAFFWVGSETDWNGVGARHRRAPFDDEVPESEKTDQILAWLDLPEPERPRLILSWWHGADGAGHRGGPDAEAVAEAVAAQDRELGRLLDGLDQRGLWKVTTLVIVSDHGMAPVGDAIDLGPVQSGHGIAARVVPAGGAAFVYLEEPSRRDEALAYLRALDGVEAYRSDALPEDLRAGHPIRAGDLVVVTEPPRTFHAPRGFWSGLRRTVARWLGARRGGHGYAPSRPDMGGIFYATGRGVPAGLELGAMKAIDVAPTLAHLLGIEPPADSEGTRIPGIASAR